MTRTCPGPGAAGGQGGDAAAEPTPGGGGAAAGTGAGEDGGEGGGPIAQCTAAADCSNDDPKDGVEACVDGACRPGDAPPRVVSVTPDAEAADVEPNTTIVIELSEPLAAETVTSDSVQVVDGETLVPGKLSYEDGIITFVPDAPLALLGSYEVVVTGDVTDEAGVALVEQFNSTFSVRDGSWHVDDVVKEKVRSFSASRMSPSGALLLGWSGYTGNKGCPTKVDWLELGEASVTPRVFPTAASHCVPVLTAANASGIGVVAWWEVGDTYPHYLQQYRNGSWLSQPLQVSNSPEEWILAVAVSPLGVATRVQQTVGKPLSAWRTDDQGTWQPNADVLVPATLQADYAPSIAFDAEGNGMMAFIAKDTQLRPRILASRYTVDTGKWSTAQELPDSLGAVDDDYATRSIPVVKLTPSGDGIVVWRKGLHTSGTATLMSNYFLANGGWERAEVLSTGTKVTLSSAPTLTFDGQRFVAAWQGTSTDGLECAFTARYDREQGWELPEGHDAKRLLPQNRPPLIVSDGRGSLLLVWSTSATAPYTLFHRRFTEGGWGAIEPIPDSIEPSLEQLTVSMNASGFAALVWTHGGGLSLNTSLRVARLH